jgi:hypothetical protein
MDTSTTQLEINMASVAEIKIGEAIEKLNIPDSQIWDAYKNHKFWCQRHSEYPMDKDSFFGNYEFKALEYHNNGFDISDEALLDPLHGYNGEIDYDHMKKSGYKG